MRLAPLAAGTLALLLSTPAVAHLDPTEGELARARGVASSFETGAELFALSMHLEEAVAVPLDILVPPQSQWANHRPALALVGPGLPSPSSELAEQLPFAVPDGHGVWVQWNRAEERPIVFENTTNRIFWSSPSVALPLLGGDHALWVWSPDGTDGDFAVGIGVDDDAVRAELVRVGELEEVTR